MFGSIKWLVRNALATCGYQILRIGKNEYSPANVLGDVDPWIQDIACKVRPYTMTSPYRVAALCQAIEYVYKREIPGDIVECGVWKGGSSMAAALSLIHLGDTSRTLHLFDTFEGMPPPTNLDRRQDGVTAAELLASRDKNSGYWARSSLEEVKTNLSQTGYPTTKIRFIPGMVEATIPTDSLTRIAILRLDTDWYESTKHELEYLYPILSNGGVLIIDDYGFWQGARRAVDEYFGSRRPILLNRIDDTGRVSIKT